MMNLFLPRPHLERLPVQVAAAQGESAKPVDQGPPNSLFDRNGRGGCGWTMLLFLQGSPPPVSLSWSLYSYSSASSYLSSPHHSLITPPPKGGVANKYNNDDDAERVPTMSGHVQYIRQERVSIRMLDRLSLAQSYPLASIHPWPCLCLYPVCP